MKRSLPAPLKRLAWVFAPQRGGSRSVRGQLMAVVVQTTVIALVLAAVGMSVQDLVFYRQGRASQLATEANILALAAAPALAFDDRAAAERTLAGLRAHSAVQSAALYGTDGRRFAQYVASGEQAPPPLLPGAHATLSLSGQELELVQRIRRNGEWLGSIYLRAHFDLWGRVWTYLAIVCLVSLLALLIALVLSNSLQRVLTTPLSAMARVAGAVARGDYTRRAPLAAEDEIGVLVLAFNRMLDEIQARAQALREADRRKDEFLATLAHELRNPLAPIRNAAELLGLRGADDRQRQWAREVIARQVRRMGLLLDDLLDVSRITRGRLVLRKSSVSLSALVATAIETARPLIDARQHELSVSLPAEPLELHVDALRLSQAISNLLHNAAKYTDTRGHIRLAAERDGASLRVTVEDDGIGIEPAALPRLFEMFAQLDSAVDRAEGGLGIGLALVRGLVQLHGGTVEATSAGHARGSRFTLRLPDAIVTASAAPAAPAMPALRAGTVGTERLLIADDNQDSAESLAMVLRLWGYQTLLAHNGTAALELALAERPSALILDIGMPGLSGYEIARRIREQPWGREVLLLALTGWGQTEDVERARAAGFDEHMTKPVDLARVDALLARYFRSDHERRVPGGPASA